MKIAVCLYGLIGGSTGRDGEGELLDPKISYDSYKKNLFKDNEIDFFIHSWNKDYEKEIIELYSPKKYLFEEQFDFSHISYKDYLIDHIDTYRAIFENYSGNIGDKLLTGIAQRSNSRWLSAKKSINLFKDYCKETGTNYDLVIHLRFDLFFVKELLIDEKFLGEFSCVRRERDNDEAIDDLIFISTPKQAIEFSKLKDNIFNYSIRPPFAAMQHLKHLKIIPKFNIKKDTFILTRNIKKKKNLFSRIKNKIKKFIRH